MAVVYRHRRLDTNEIFYVGIGKTERRAHVISGRNRWWENVVNSCEYQVEILVRDITKEDACELEELLIQEYGRRDLGTGCLVNLTSGGEGLEDLSPEIVKRIAEAKHKEVEQYNFNYKFLNTYKSAKEASEKVGLRYSNLVGACNQKIRSCGGFFWKYKEDSFIKKDWKHCSSKKPVIQYDLGGKFIKEYESLSEAGRVSKVFKSSISGCCRKVYGFKTAGGFIWKYKE